MTREDINNYAEKCADENMVVHGDYPFYPDDYESYKEAYIKTFKDGVEYADSHPKSPWISIKDDLPCNHEELMFYDKTTTKKVFALIDSTIPVITFMSKCKNIWCWEWGAITHWFPIPELPKE